MRPSGRSSQAVAQGWRGGCQRRCHSWSRAGALQVKLAVALEFVCPLLLGVSHYNQASPKWDRWVKRVMTAVRGPLPGSSQIRGIAERFPPRGGPAGFSAAHARALNTHPQIGLTWTRSWVCFFKTSYFPILFVPEI